MVAVKSQDFKRHVTAALADAGLQESLRQARQNFVGKRAAAVAALPEFEELRSSARAIKDHALAHLDLYLEAFEAKVREQGGHVHWAQDAVEARGLVVDICRKALANTVAKGKSMVSEEIALNELLEAGRMTPIETDLGEYIIQLRGEHPSHIIAPAVHLSLDQVRDDFRKAHRHLPADRPLEEPESLLREARAVLREKFLAADVGLTGANFLIAETGSAVIVTNEGNGDLTQTLPRVHIVLASIEKIVPTLEDATQILRLLARSATGQEMTVYTTFATGPKRDGDLDGPEQFHVVLLDNGRSKMLGSEFEDMLRCIRCGACINHCPVYQAIGGHAYGWVYPGPMGAVLTPAFVGIERAGDLPNASTFCGRCESVCPMQIPLPNMMRHWREKEFERHLSPARQRHAIRLWAWLARHPRLYHRLAGPGMFFLSLLAGFRRRFRWLPLADEWTQYRDLPAPQGRTFIGKWPAYKRRRARRR